MWLRQAVAKLARFGYQQREVAEMTLLNFVVTLDAVNRVAASERMDLVVDIATVASAMAPSKKKSNPIKEHLDLLEGVQFGDANGNAE